MKLLACPKCHQQLHLENKTLKCENNHCYDISKRGYINLLLNPDKATNNPGDSKESLVARKAYLNKGYYDPILNQVITCIDEFKHQDDLSILDLGCGEGYYTQGLKKHFENSDIYGLDISKIAIDMATRYRKDIDHSMDIITALFTVVNQDELKRALKEDGYIIHVTANNQHLIEIKELIYDEIKVKSDKYIRLDFNQVKSYDFKEKVHISNREDALNLLMMTPHYYHIKKEKRSVLDTLQGLDITINIKVTVYALS